MLAVLIPCPKGVPMLQPMQAGLWLLQGWPPAAGSNVSRLAGARPAWEDADAPTLPLSRPIPQQQDQLASSAAPAASGTAPAAGPQGADSEETRPLSRPPIYTRCAALGCLRIRATPATGIDSDDTRPLSRSPAHTWVRVLSSAGPHVSIAACGSLIVGKAIYGSAAPAAGGEQATGT